MFAVHCGRPYSLTEQSSKIQKFIRVVLNVIRWCMSISRGRFEPQVALQSVSST